jgi:hypothetical protein
MFFDPQGNKISKEEFVDFYSKCYYLNNSHVAEERIQNLLDADKLSPEDVMLILRWKLGKIDHKRSQCNHSIVNRGNEEGFITLDGRGRSVKAKPMCFYVSENLDSMKKSTGQEILNQLVDECSVQNIGTVYLITILFFITNGRYPIYDRFAAAALCAITKEKEPGEEVKNIELPSKDQESFRNLLTENDKPSKYQNYINQLEKLFDEDYKKDRRIDQALWVYGHLFQIKD